MNYLIKKLNTKLIKKILITTFIIGMVAHGYCYFNTLLSHDSLTDLYVNDPNVMISIGRFIRPIYRLFRSGYTLPIINGILFLLFMSGAIYLIIDIFNIQRTSTIIFISGILITNYSTSLLHATYIHDIDAYALSLFLSLLGVWISVKKENKLFLTIMFFIIALGLYQTYISVVLCCYLILAIISLIDGNASKDIIVLFIKRILVVVVAMVIYYVLFKVVLVITGVVQSSYVGSASNALKLSFESIIERFQNIKDATFKWFNNPGAINVVFVRCLNIVLILLLLFMSILIIKDKKIEISQLVLIILFIILIPFGMNAVTFISNQYHDLTLYPFFMCYIFLLIFYDKYEFTLFNIIKPILTILLSIMIFENCLFSNTIYVKKDLEQRSTLSLYTRIVDRMEQVDGYEPGKTKIAIVGKLDNSPLQNKREGFEFDNTGLTSNYSTTYYKTYHIYFENVLGYAANILDENESLKIANKEIVKDMPSFPYKDSIRFVDGVMVIKLSN